MTKNIFAALVAFIFALSPAFALADTADVTTGLNAEVNTTVSAPGTGSAGASANAAVHANAAAKIQSNVTMRADQELDRRVTNLNTLSTRVSGINNLSDSDKTTIETALSGQVSALTSLKTKIDADTDTSVLKTDVQSITASYRIYALILPQVRIIAAADRAVTVAKLMQELGTKLQGRITAAASSGTDVTAATAALADFSAKISDAGVQAQAAVSAVDTLAPDHGDQAKMTANIAALTDAHAKLQAAETDLKAARKDAATIIAAVKGKPVTANASAGASASTNAQ